MIRQRYFKMMGRLALATLGAMLYLASPSIAKAQDAALNLRLVTAELKNVQSPIIGTGTIFAHKTSKIGPIVGGQVREIYVNVGDRVQKGDPLFKINPDRYRYAFEEAKANHAMAVARFNEVKSALDRAQKLFKKDSISQSQLDKARSAVALVKAEIDAAKVRVDKAETDLEDTVLKAPFAGAITFRYVNEGVYLSSQVPGGSSAIVELQKIDIAIAIVQVPARELENLYVGAPVKLMIDGISTPVNAQISIINDKVDIETRTLEVRIGMENFDFAIKPGLFVKAEILPKSRSAVVILRDAVQGPRDEHYVFVLQGGKAVRKTVHTIDFDATLVEVVSGLTGNERVLIGPDLLRLKDGIAVGEL